MGGKCRHGDVANTVYFMLDKKVIDVENRFAPPTPLVSASVQSQDPLGTSKGRSELDQCTADSYEMLQRTCGICQGVREPAFAY